jgi:hypothetical protein
VIKEVQQPGVGVLGVVYQDYYRALGGELLEEQPPPANSSSWLSGPCYPGEGHPEQSAQRSTTYARSSGSGPNLSSRAVSLPATISAWSSAAPGGAESATGDVGATPASGCR